MRSIFIEKTTEYEFFTVIREWYNKNCGIFPELLNWINSYPHSYNISISVFLSYLKADEIFSANQSGFTEVRPTQDAALSVSDEISNNIGEGKLTLCILIHLEKSLYTITVGYRVI